ncbi:MAG: phenylalanine--tRNA ligase subunit beta [Candidatus Saccharimonadales bacterium]
MIISLNWLKKFTSVDIPVDQLANLIGARLVEIEETVSLIGKYDGALIVKVVECAKLEGSDHLNVTKIDDGGITQNIERDENGYIQVVCGAPNVRADILAVWLTPGSTVPSTVTDKEPFVLGARKLRGVISNGMLASAHELDLFEDHSGILEVTSDNHPGTKFADAFELDDCLLDIENKSLTHRPDTFGIIGFAREVAAIQEKQFTTPSWLETLNPDFGDKSGDLPAPIVSIDSPELSARYQAVVLSGADASRQSPLMIQTYLSRVGVRPINAVVDVTNYLMMLTGQPLHAFDYDKVLAVGGEDPTIHVRGGYEGETLELLDGRSVELDSGDIVIASGKTAIGLAGALGGSNTEIDENTKNIIIESATFNLYNLRSTQMRHGIFSEAITRFTKGQPAELTAPVLAEAVRLMDEWAGAKRVSDIADCYVVKHEPLMLGVHSLTINNVLGSYLTGDDIRSILGHVEFHIKKIDDEMSEVTAPYWRSDIHIIEDIIEEVGRLHGFDSITPTLPTRDFTAVRPDTFDQLRSRIRDVLVRAGTNEVLTYSFIHGDVLKKANQNPQDSYRITNSLSPDLQYYRQSLTPSLLGLIHPNIKSGYESFSLFEMNKTHTKKADLVEDNVPAEQHRLALIIASKVSGNGAPYYKAKKIVEYLGASLGLKLAYKSFPDETDLAFTKPFELRRSARVVDVATGQSIGIVGEYKRSVIKNFKLPEYTAGFELLPAAISLALLNVEPAYSPLSRFPASERDVCFKVDTNTSYSSVIDAINITPVEESIAIAVSPVDIYQAEDLQSKNITVRFRLTPRDKTLTSDDVHEVVNNLTDAVISATNAIVI